MVFEAPGILDPLPPVSGTPWSGWITLAVAGLLIVAPVIWAMWNRRYRPRWHLRRLRRDLRRQRINPRRAAHALAVVLRDGRLQARSAAALLDELDALRFRRESPSAGQLLGLIVRAELSQIGRLHDE
jgi:hypothetical protein